MRSADAADPVIRLKDVYRTYEMGDQVLNALDGVSLDIMRNEYVAIVGASGSGKSTMMNIIGCLDRATKGDYLLNGVDVGDMSEAQLARARNREIGFIFQSFNLIDELTVAENIELALLYHNMPSAERKRRVDAVMDRMGIAHRARHMPGQLSGGQQQRVAVARAVVGDQPLILADEPTGNLDSVHGQEVMELLRSLNSEGTTIVMVTHSPAHADYARRTVNLFDGHVLTDKLRAA